MPLNPFNKMKKMCPERSVCLESLCPVPSWPCVPFSLVPRACSLRVCQAPHDPDGGQKTIQEKCKCLWVCLSLGLWKSGEGLGCRQGMLFKTKKEMLAQNGKERKQLPVSGVGFLIGGALSSPLAWAGWGLSRYASCALQTSTCLRSRVPGALLFILPR